MTGHSTLQQLSSAYSVAVRQPENEPAALAEGPPVKGHFQPTSSIKAQPACSTQPQLPLPSRHNIHHKQSCSSCHQQPTKLGSNSNSHIMKCRPSVHMISSCALTPTQVDRPDRPPARSAAATVHYASSHCHASWVAQPCLASPNCPHAESSSCHPTCWSPTKPLRSYVRQMREKSASEHITARRGRPGPPHRQRRPLRRARQ